MSFPAAAPATTPGSVDRRINPSTAVPAGTLDADRLIDDLFITPKVLDRRGFDDLSGVLRQLVKDAASKGESLKSAAGEVRSLSDSLREVAKQLQVRLEAALKVAPALDQRLAKAEHVVQLAIDRTALTEQLEKSIAQIIDSRLSEYGRRLDELNARHEESLALAAARLAEDIDARRARLNTETSEAWQQAEQARARVLTEVDSFQQMIRAQVDAASERLSEPVRVADRKASELAARLEAEMEAAEDRLRAAREQADVKLAGLVETISRHADAVNRRAQEEASSIDLRLRDLVDQAASRAETIRTQTDQRSTEAVARMESQCSLFESRFDASLAQAETSLSEFIQGITTHTENARRQGQETAQELDATLRQVVERASARADELAAETSRRTGQVSAELESQLVSTEARFQACKETAESKLGEFVQGLSIHSSDALREAREAAATLECRLKEAVEQAVARTESLAAQADARVAEVGSRLDAQFDSVSTRLHATREQADAQLVDLIQTIAARAEEAAKQAERQASDVDRDLQGILERAAARVETMRGQTTQLQSAIASSLDEASSLQAERSRQVVDQAAGELTRRSQELEAAHAKTLTEALSSSLTTLQDHTALANRTTDKAMETIRAAGNAAVDDAMQAGSQVAARLVDLGRSTLQAIQETEEGLRTQAQQVTANIERTAADIKTRIEPAKRLLDGLPSAIDQQLALFQTRLAEMIAPTVKQLDQLCTAASAISVNQASPGQS